MRRPYVYRDEIEVATLASLRQFVSFMGRVEELLEAEYGRRDSSASGGR